MIEWIKRSKIVYAFVALVVGTVFNIGVVSATMPRAKDFAIEREARADLQTRMTAREEHDKAADRDDDDMKAWRVRVEETLINIAIQVGAPLPKKGNK